MDIKAEHQEKVTIVVLSGEIDALSASKVAAFLDRQLRAGKNQLVADLSQLSFMSSAGLRALLAALKETRHQKGDLRLAAARDNVHEVLKMSGFTGLFQVFPTVEAAVTSFGD